MRNLGCLRVVARGLLLLAAGLLIFFLGRSALEGIRDRQNRDARLKMQIEQAATYPAAATQIAEINATVFSDAAPALELTATTDLSAGTAGAIIASTAAIATETAAETVATIPPAPEVTPETTPEVMAADAEETAEATLAATDQMPAAVVTATEFIIPSSTFTSTALLPTETATATITASATAVPTDLPTEIPTPTRTATVTNSAVPTETSTATATATATKTSTSTTVPTNTPLRALPTNTRRPGLATNTPRAAADANVAATSVVVAVLPTNVPVLVATTLAPPTFMPSALPPTATPVPPTFTPSPEPTVELIAAIPTLQATSTLPRVLGRDTCVEGEKLDRQPTAVPPPAPRLRGDGSDIMNILLLGTDQDVAPNDPSFRTDVLMIVSINRTSNTVAMLSIPRDLYVCIPALGMNRINVAYEWGEAVGWDPNGGFGLLRETILYNMGIPVHYYARVSLTGFKQIVDSVGGVDIAVDCPINNSLRWLGNYDAENNPIYEPFSLPTGYYHMDGSFALWYARERVSDRATDFDRNRRQQQVLRAIWRAARDQGLIQKAPELWNQLTSIVATDLTLLDALGLAPLALDLAPGEVTTYVMYKGYQLEHFKTPQGEDVQIPVPDAFFQTINNFYTPPSANRLGVEALKIEVYDGSGRDGWDKLAADVIGWKGLPAAAMGKIDAAARTVIYDYTGGGDQGVISLLRKAYNLRPDQIIDQPDPNRTVDYKIVVGADFNACSAPGYTY